MRPKFKQAETERDEQRLTAADYRQLMLHPDRIGEIAQYILRNFRLKTHRAQGGKGFNAMFAVSSVEAAKRYYEELTRRQAEAEHPLRIATIFLLRPQRGAKMRWARSTRRRSNRRRGRVGERSF